MTTVTVFSRLPDEELLKECDKQFGNPLVVELQQRLAVRIDSDVELEAKIETLEAEKFDTDKANEALTERCAELSLEITELENKVSSLTDALDLLS